MAVESNGDDVPTRYALAQNYPSPFNPTTRIDFDLPETSRVSLRVFDILGREIAVLAEGEFPAGRFSTVWNATGLPSSVHLYCIKAGSFSALRRLV
ncbi:MAG: T9SS C-terminal target domain-containing protein, partial [Bacteroidota bacterium]